MAGPTPHNRRWSDERLDDLARDVDRLATELPEAMRDHRKDARQMVSDMRSDVTGVERRVMAALDKLEAAVTDVRTGSDESIRQLGERLDVTTDAIVANRFALRRDLVAFATPIAVAVLGLLGVIIGGK